MVTKARDTEPKVTGHGRGFASLSEERKREIAAKGGRQAHINGTAHKWNSEEAKKAGQRGGSISRRRPKTVQVEQA